MKNQQPTATIKARPILFSGPMVRALLDGTKTQTRRALAGKHIFNDEPDRYKCHGIGEIDSVGRGREFGALFEDLRPEITPWFNPVPCPYGEVGDRLWVRETHASGFSSHVSHCGYLYRATDVHDKSIERRYCYEEKGKYFDHYGKPFKWKPSIFMRQQASRILLQITAVRCERLQRISCDDAVAEGIERIPHPHPPFGTSWKNYLDEESHCPHVVDSYSTLWKKISGLDSWEANPWVWVVEFKVISAATPQQESHE